MNADKTESVHIGGLTRVYDADWENREGGLVDNGLAVWDAADIYHRYKKEGLFLEDIEARERVFERSKGEVPGKLASELTSGERDYYEAIIRAGAHGIPDSLLEPYVFFYEDIEQIINISRIASLIGRKVTDTSQPTDEQTMVERGREILDRSSYLATYDAHGLIEQIFLDDADLILTPEAHPDSFKEIHDALQKAEERAGIASL